MHCTAGQYNTTRSPSPLNFAVRNYKATVEKIGHYTACLALGAAGEFPRAQRGCQNLNDKGNSWLGKLGVRTRTQTTNHFKETALDPERHFPIARTGSQLGLVVGQTVVLSDFCAPCNLICCDVPGKKLVLRNLLKQTEKTRLISQQPLTWHQKPCPLSSAQIPPDNSLLLSFTITLSSQTRCRPNPPGNLDQVVSVAPSPDLGAISSLWLISGQLGQQFSFTSPTLLASHPSSSPPAFSRSPLPSFGRKPLPIHYLVTPGSPKIPCWKYTLALKADKRPPYYRHGRQVLPLFLQ